MFDFIYFMIKLEGTALRWGAWLDNLFVLCPGVHCLKANIWHNELSTVPPNKSICQMGPSESACQAKLISILALGNINWNKYNMF